ncbi:hypothetical protein RRG08_062734 [Elysia crispata]|uniref:Uncharacterized protein n=1 Tax=Elysia crispata TaxID=231223 RepID=A0AAE1DJ45_9GAST|nr:hypothetical protein RRG08_062734 [Elysia crispata]
MSAKQIATYIEMFRGQRDSESEEEYNSLRDQMAAVCPPDVVQYFEQQWWGCPRLWAAHCSGSPTFHVTTTNHAESFHQKIKRGLNNSTSLSAALAYLCEASTNMTTARNMKAIVDAVLNMMRTKTVRQSTSLKMTSPNLQVGWLSSSSFSQKS